MSHDVLELAARGPSESEFLHGIARLLLDRTRASAVDLWVRKDLRWLRVSGGAQALQYEVVRGEAIPPEGALTMSVGGERVGAAAFHGGDPGPLRSEIEGLLGILILNQRAHAALRERIKELSCLYGIAHVEERLTDDLDDVLQAIVNLLPPAWQYPECVAGRLILGDRSYTTAGFREGAQRQSANLLRGREIVGKVEVFYTEPKPEEDEGPFLKEERNLIDAIAGQVGMILESRRAAEQLRHADRLATIGQLAAGVAHELNEPLGGILGFAQLARKAPGTPPSVTADLEKIERATLRAREIIRNLLTFGRHVPHRREPVDLNAVVGEGLTLFEGRCGSADVELVRELSCDRPLAGDATQLRQVVVNLVANAVQSMPRGGRLTVKTARRDDVALLIVEDTGSGMGREVLGRLFTPFFTTKDVDQGTGLGLSVVHGIVTSHGGRIRVDSEPGRGSRFEVELPLGGADGR